MAKRRRPTPSKFRPLFELGRKYSLQRQTMQKLGVDSRSMPRPTTREKVAVCKFLLDHPDQIAPWDKYVLPILKGWLGKTKLPKRTLSAKDVAELVDLADVEKTTESQLRARKTVAKALGMTFDAVKRSHNKHGKLPREKSR
ncbi:hypothetical protein JQ582_34810 [Bradyrhizobium japonicum]|uniref:hypothetical protein n=1 Tax=Bradyrhizobium japonicum TaxID=375 RepID=UPI001BABCB56|nr:hypothetical protein [Bradyrhizobium japonicum]MBR0749114.1 hypothetical protein [Bradyrhizobium japonicum]